jgi:hypothetical protein
VKAVLNALSTKQKVALLIIVALVVGSILYHVHPNMDGLQEQLESKAPTLFKLFLMGEAIYFAGMIMMAVGLGKSLGPNLLTWGGKLKEMMSAENQILASAKFFWVGFACNVIGSLTFGLIGLYVAAEILPSGSKTLIPASMMDMSFSLFVRLAFYRRFSKAPAAPSAE